MTEYYTGQELLNRYTTENQLSTGSPELDKLIGGIQRGLFYFFYGEKKLMETLFQHMTTRALAANEKGKPVVVYMLMGN
ncbi:hypothetical protein HN807_07680 [Candidatus Bathyarchaeota archaeon]|nr:hypothetical protein [Candidatus Bathyarchaeota archaeon]